MSSKKFVYLVMTVAIVCGFMLGDTAYGQKGIGALTVKGTVTNVDGTPATNHTIAGEITGASTIFDPDGSTGEDGVYFLVFVSSTKTAEITAGDIVHLTVTDKWPERCRDGEPYCSR